MGQTFFAAQFFISYRYFIETTATDIDTLLQVLLQFCNNNGFVTISNVIMLFCPLVDDWILCRIGVARHETWSYSNWLRKCSIHYTYSVSTLWCSQVWLYCSYSCTYLNNIPKIKQPIFFITKHRVHEYVSGLTSTPEAELICSCKVRKCIGLNKVKISKL